MNSQHIQQIATEIHVLTMMMMKAHARSAEEHLRENGSEISMVQFGILRILSNNSRTLSEVSKVIVLDPSTLVPIIDDLERKGLIERNKDPLDRRRTPLSLTADGKALIEKHSEFTQSSSLYQSVVQLGEEKSVQLVELLREIVGRLPDGETMLCDVQEHIYKRSRDLSTLSREPK